MQNTSHRSASSTVTPVLGAEQDQIASDLKRRLRVFVLAQCITEACVARRGNNAYLSAAGRRKVLNLCFGLSAHGHDVTILSSSFAKGNHYSWKENVAAGIRVHHTPTIGLLGRHSVLKRTVTAMFNCIEILKYRHSIDLIIIYNYHAEFSIPALIARKALGLPFVLDYEDGLFLDKSYSGTMFSLLERAVYKNCAGFILVNPDLRKRIDKIGRGQASLITSIVHSYFNIGAIDTLEASPGTHRELLFSGNFSYGFGFDELKRYVACLPPTYSLNICGRAGVAETQEIQLWCGRHPRAKFLGFVSESALDELMRRARAVILLNEVTSDFNRSNFPSKLYDYFSRGKIVISTRNPLLRRYDSMHAMLVLDSIERDMPNLDQLLQDRRFVPEEVRDLHCECLAQLARLVDTTARQQTGEC